MTCKECNVNGIERRFIPQGHVHCGTCKVILLKNFILWKGNAFCGHCADELILEAGS